MRPIPIPRWLREADWVEGTNVFSSPDGNLLSRQIPPVEGVYYRSKLAGYGDREFPMVAAVLYLEDDDLARIEAGSRYLLLPWPGRRMPVFLVPEVLELVHREAGEGGGDLH